MIDELAQADQCLCSCDGPRPIGVGAEGRGRQPIEGWFHLLTERRLRRSTLNSVSQLVDAIEVRVDHWNDDPKPFIWKKPADEILAKVRRGRAALNTQTKSATHH